MSAALSRLEHPRFGGVSIEGDAFDGLIEGFAACAAYKD
jgi:hypothetical protein